MTGRRPALALGFVSIVAALHGCSGDADFSDVMPEPVTLSAEAYRTEISGIDRLVFEEGPYSEKRGRALGESLEELARRVKATSDSRFLALESLELRHLASMAKELPPDAPRAPLQNNWMRLRSNLFDDREWFARSAADLPPSQAPTRVPAMKFLQPPKETRAGSHVSSPPARAGGGGG